MTISGTYYAYEYAAIHIVDDFNYFQRDKWNLLFHIRTIQ